MQHSIEVRSCKILCFIFPLLRILGHSEFQFPDPDILPIAKYQCVLHSKPSNKVYVSFSGQFSTTLVFPHVMKMTEALLAHEIDGALVDNYVLTHSLNLIQKEPIRIERYIDHSITYGVVLPKNSSRFEKCVRSFLQNHPQEIFEIIADNLVPLKVSVNSNFCFFSIFLIL